MAIIKLSDAWKQTANWVAGTVLAFMRDQSLICLDGATDLQGGDLEQARFVYLKSKDAVYRLDLSSVAADDGETVIRDSVGRRYLRIGGKAFDVYTAANIASAAHAVNTSGKRQGRTVYDTTNHRLMVANGTTATAIWYVSDGSASVTPT